MATQFVIYGQSRSGSTLLVDLLNRHPAIHCDEELFNKESGYFENVGRLRLSQYFPFPFIYLMKRRAPRDVYGFKLLFYQIRFTRPVVRALHLSGWRFIHLRRRNLVRQSLSKLIANRTQRWQRYEGDSAPDHRVTVGVDQLDRELRVREAWTRSELDCIAGIPHLDLCYETDLEDAAAWPATLARVAAFLEIQPFDTVHSKIKRIDERPYAEVIVNHAELAAHLERTAYAGQLDDR